LFEQKNGSCNCWGGEATAEFGRGGKKGHPDLSEQPEKRERGKCQDRRHRKKASLWKKKTDSPRLRGEKKVR